MVYKSKIQREELEKQLKIAEEKQEQKEKIQKTGFICLCIFACLCCFLQVRILSVISVVGLVLGFMFLVEFVKVEDKRVEKLRTLLELKDLETKIGNSDYEIKDSDIIVDEKHYDGTDVICKDGLDFRYLDEKLPVEVEHINFTVKKNHVKLYLNVSFFFLFFGLIYVGVYMYSNLSEFVKMTVGVILLLLVTLGGSFLFYFLATKDEDLYKRVCFEEYDNFCKQHKKVYVSEGSICSESGKRIKIEKEYLTEVKQNEGKLDFRL